MNSNKSLYYCNVDNMSSICFNKLTNNKCISNKKEVNINVKLLTLRHLFSNYFSISKQLNLKQNNNNKDLKVIDNLIDELKLRLKHINLFSMNNKVIESIINSSNSNLIHIKKNYNIFNGVKDNYNNKSTNDVFLFVEGDIIKFHSIHQYNNYLKSNNLSNDIIKSPDITNDINYNILLNRINFNNIFNINNYKFILHSLTDVYYIKFNTENIESIIKDYFIYTYDLNNNSLLYSLRQNYEDLNNISEIKTNKLIDKFINITKYKNECLVNMNNTNEYIYYLVKGEIDCIINISFNLDTNNISTKLSKLKKRLKDKNIKFTNNYNRIDNSITSNSCDNRIKSDIKLTNRKSSILLEKQLSSVINNTFNKNNQDKINKKYISKTFNKFDINKKSNNYNKSKIKKFKISKYITKRARDLLVLKNNNRKRFSFIKNKMYFKNNSLNYKYNNLINKITCINNEHNDYKKNVIKKLNIKNNIIDNLNQKSISKQSNAFKIISSNWINIENILSDSVSCIMKNNFTKQSCSPVIYKVSSNSCIIKAIKLKDFLYFINNVLCDNSKNNIINDIEIKVNKILSYYFSKLNKSLIQLKNESHCLNLNNNLNENSINKYFKHNISSKFVNNFFMFVSSLKDKTIIKSNENEKKEIYNMYISNLDAFNKLYNIPKNKNNHKKNLLKFNNCLIKKNNTLINEDTKLNTIMTCNILTHINNKKSFNDNVNLNNKSNTTTVYNTITSLNKQNLNINTIKKNKFNTIVSNSSLDKEMLKSCKLNRIKNINNKCSELLITELKNNDLVLKDVKSYSPKIQSLNLSHKFKLRDINNIYNNNLKEYKLINNFNFSNLVSLKNNKYKSFISNYENHSIVSKKGFVRLKMSCPNYINEKLNSDIHKDNKKSLNILKCLSVKNTEYRDKKSIVGNINKNEGFDKNIIAEYNSKYVNKISKNIVSNNLDKHRININYNNNFNNKENINKKVIIFQNKKVFSNTIKNNNTKTIKFTLYSNSNKIEKKF